MTKVETTLHSTILVINMPPVDQKVENGALVLLPHFSLAGTPLAGRNRCDKEYKREEIAF